MTTKTEADVIEPGEDKLARRRRNTKWAARRRAAKLARENANATFCQHRLGSFSCGGRLEDRVDRALGIVTRICPKCERRKQGICERCPLPVYGAIGRSKYCDTHFNQARREAIRRSQEIHGEARASRARASLLADPVRRARKLEYKRLWRKANPDKIRKQKRRFALRQNRHNLEWHKQYNAKRRAAKADDSRERYRADNPIPTPRCASCGRDIPWMGRTKGSGRPPRRCVFCMDKYQLRHAVKQWAATTDRELAAPVLPVKKVRPWKPKIPTRINAAGDRLCLTHGCKSVCTGRQKKCGPCLAGERVAARELLERSRGRGRRTDLERESA